MAGSLTGFTLGALFVVLAGGCALDRVSPPSAATTQPVQAKPAPLPVAQLLRRPGGFYNDDAPDSTTVVNLDAIADPAPRVEPMNDRANEPYTVFGREYAPYKALIEYRREGTISWYGRKFHGQRTWSGDVYDMYAMTAAHPTLPIPSYARVTNLENRRSVIVRINDRGPFHSGRIMDVSYAAAYRLGFSNTGTATVEVETLFPGGAPARTTVSAPAPRPAPASAAKPASLVADSQEPAPTVTATTGAGGVYLQLGAFGSNNNAESFRSKIQPQLADLKLAAQVALQANLYRVNVGPFRSRAEANQISEKLRESLGIRPVIVVR